MKYSNNYKTLHDIVESEDDIVDWLVEDLLLSRQPSLLYGQKNVHKSHLALHLGICVSEGSDFFGMPTKQSPVIFMALEGSETMKPRIIAHWSHYGEPEESNFVVIGDQFQFGKDEDELLAFIESMSEELSQVGLVIIDTLSYAYPPGDENSASTARIISKGLMRICTEGKTSVLVIHHGGKDMGRGARGSSVLEDDVPTVLVAQKNKLKVKHQRSGQSGQVYAFNLLVKELNDRGDTALCIAYDDAQDAGVSGWGLKLLRKLDEMSIIHPEGVSNSLLFDEVLSADPRRNEEGYRQGSFKTQYQRTKKSLVTSKKISVTSGLIKRNNQ